MWLNQALWELQNGKAESSIFQSKNKEQSITVSVSLKKNRGMDYWSKRLGAMKDIEYIINMGVIVAHYEAGNGTEEILDPIVRAAQNWGTQNWVGCSLAFPGGTDVCMWINV